MKIKIKNFGSVTKNIFGSVAKNHDIEAKIQFHKKEHKKTEYLK